MGHTGNMIIKYFIRQMCVPLIGNCVYFGDGDGFNSNPEDIFILYQPTDGTIAAKSLI